MPARSATSSRRLLRRAMTSPPFLQSRAWQIVKAAPHPSQCISKSVGSMPYHMKRESLHYCASNSVPLTVKGITDSHTPVHLIRPSHRVYISDAAAWASPREVSASSACLRCISSLPHRWNLPVLCYHDIMVIYLYPFLVVITLLLTYVIFIKYCICILTGSPR